MAESGKDTKLEETNNDSAPVKEKEEYKESVKVSPGDFVGGVMQEFFGSNLQSL